MIYLDNAATTYPKPNCVYRETASAMRNLGGNPGRGSHTAAARAADALYDLRETAADFFEAEAENVVLTYNATHALNLAIKGLAEDGCHILMSDMEHNSVRRPVLSLCREKGCTCDVFESHMGEPILVLSSLEKHLKSNTRLLVTTHVSNICNVKLPLRTIAKFCAHHGIRMIVDASQSAGHLPLSMRELGADAICMPGHKGLYGPAGTGLLILKGNTDVKTLLEGGSGADSLLPQMPHTLPERLEAGTLSAPLAAGLARAIRWVSSVGLGDIRAAECNLALSLASRLCDMDFIKTYASPLNHVGGTVLFNMDGFSPAELSRELDRLGICVRSGLHCAPLAHSTVGTGEDGAVRVSFGHFNSLSDVKRLVSALFSLKKEKG